MKKNSKATNIKKYYANKAKKQHINKCLIKKRIEENKEDDFSRIYHSVRSRINKTLKKNNIEFRNTYEEIIGCETMFEKLYIRTFKK